MPLGAAESTGMTARRSVPPAVRQAAGRRSEGRDGERVEMKMKSDHVCDGKPDDVAVVFLAGAWCTVECLWEFCMFTPFNFCPFCGKSAAELSKERGHRMARPMSVEDFARVARLAYVADVELAARLCVTLSDECFSGDVSAAAAATLSDIRAGRPVVEKRVLDDGVKRSVVEGW